MSPYRAARLFSPQQRSHTFYASFAIRSGTPCLRAASYAAPQAPALVLLLGLTLILVPGRRPAPAHAGAMIQDRSCASCMPPPAPNLTAPRLPPLIPPRSINRDTTGVRAYASKTAQTPLPAVTSPQHPGAFTRRSVLLAPNTAGPAFDACAACAGAISRRRALPSCKDATTLPARICRPIYAVYDAVPM
ncbi:hypothetical protein HYPSUDRAFT_201300 [Hypholoma sublateritium FD-334 SS-4]|uniref:Uncharacterized protein n=1 Tax=Hypholoma sublateritium (strain FD-334 SS-4) TaxID=945553 RepID=A0A0D2PVL1_HYPSF|nr:hypothetical protein HYPSUDRAFT_201300 [Hypholoma sublateritium FD-334 SS-4]